MSFTLIRHAPPLIQGICYGTSDIPVQAVSHVTLTMLRSRWQSEGTPPLWCSPAQRCLQLALQIADSRHERVHSDTRLRELHFGSWENIPWSEIPRVQLDTWGQNWQQERPPAGESFAELCARLESFLDEHKQTTIWVVSHAGPIRVMLGKLRQQDPALYFETPIPHLEPIHAP